MNNRLTAREREHLARIKSMTCNELDALAKTIEALV